MTYRYSKVDSANREIRLLSLHPGSFHDAIRITLNHTFLSEAENRGQYEALSYVWGSEDDPQPILVRSATSPEGYTLVTRNLEIALRYLRLKTELRVLWIDAICIDQQNVTEQSQQVTLMADIYSLAENTIIWLGPEDEDSAFALDFLGRVATKVEVDWKSRCMVPAQSALQEPFWADRSQTLKLHQRELKSVSRLFGRSWFQRLWVQQEVVLSHRKAIVCGRRAQPWELFSRAVFCLYSRRYHSFSRDFDIEYAKRQEMVFATCLSCSTSYTYGALRHDLRDLRWKKPHDAIYAILHLLRSTDRIIKVVPDYRKPAAQVYEEVCSSLAIVRQDLSFLQGCDIDSISIPNLPTWVPDWSTRLKVNSIPEILWSSCAWISAQTRYLGPGKLRAAGVRVATIEKTYELVQDDHRCDGNRLFHCIKTLLPRSGLDSRYVGGGTTLDAYAMALQRGLLSENFDVPPGVTLTLAAVRRVLLTIMASDLEPEVLDDHEMNLFLSICRLDFHGKCFFSTSKGYIGIGTASIQKTDTVSVLLGSNIPVILREKSAAPREWQVVGTCLVPGLMWGEVILGRSWDHTRPIRYSTAATIEERIDGYPVRMSNTVDGSNISNPADILSEHDIPPRRYERQPHILEVSPEVLRSKSVSLEDFDLV